MGAPSRKKRTPGMRILTPFPLHSKKESKMTAKVIFCIHLRVVFLRVPLDFILFSANDLMGEIRRSKMTRNDIKMKTP